MDNSHAEQTIDPFSVGRKNLLIIESDRCAKQSAILYNLAETAKANQVNTYIYLDRLFP